MRRAIAAVGATALILLSAPLSSAAAGEFIGVNEGAPLKRSDIRKIASTGVQTYRFMLPWASIQRAKGSFDWGTTDRLVGNGLVSAPNCW